MDYFSILNLTKEPFSNSPDPEFFYQSRQHLDCLQKLELSLHLRRGLNVIIGDVGTGKTTLCRQLIRRFAKRKDIETHLLLDPHFKDNTEFLATVAKLVSGRNPANVGHDWQLKEIIKHHLFRKGVDQKKTTILIIDEGQKIPTFCLESLREFLNYETNEFKLLQIVIFAQKEFEQIVRRHANFADRINLYHELKPLSFRDSRMMINYRLEKSSTAPKKLHLFSWPALIAIYRATGGYPRKIINLCHQCILAMIIQNREKVGYFIVKRSISRVFSRRGKSWKTLTAAATAVVAAMMLLAVMAPEPIKSLVPAQLRNLHTILGERSGSSPAEHPKTRETVSPAEEATAEAKVTPGAFELPTAIQPPSELPDPLTKAAAEPSRTAAVTAAVEAAGTERDFPEVLGRLRIRRDETLSRIIYNVYGSYNSIYMKSVILGNPDIDDPDRIEIGQALTLPALPAAVRAPSQNFFWVQVTETDALETAYDFLRTWPSDEPPVRMIPYWSPAAGTRFSIVLKNHFETIERAGQALERLPPAPAPGGSIISAWGKQIVFFADPYTGPISLNQ